MMYDVIIMKIEIRDTENMSFKTTGRVVEVTTQNVSIHPALINLVPVQLPDPTPEVAPQRGAPLENPRSNNFDFFAGTSWEGKKQAF